MCLYVRNIYDVNILLLKVTVSISPSKHVTCAVIYRPTHTPMSKFLSEFNAYCSAETQADTNDEFSFMEDFNINFMSISNNVKLFLEIMYMYYLFPMILHPNRITHKSFSLIDNFFINNPLATELGLIISDISDHLSVFVIYLVTQQLIMMLNIHIISVIYPSTVFINSSKSLKQ